MFLQLLFGIAVIAVGYFMLFHTDAYYALRASEFGKYRFSDEPEPGYVKVVRFCGGVLILMGIVLIVLAICQL